MQNIFVFVIVLRQGAKYIVMMAKHICMVMSCLPFIYMFQINFFFNLYIYIKESFCTYSICDANNISSPEYSLFSTITVYLTDKLCILMYASAMQGASCVGLQFFFTFPHRQLQQLVLCLGFFSLYIVRDAHMQHTWDVISRRLLRTFNSLYQP